MAAACGQVHYSARWIKLQELFLFHGRGGTPGRPPGLCLLGIFRRSIFIKPSPWGEGAPVRTLGRMRGQSEKQASLEELCRAGACPAASVRSFPGMRRGFRRCCGELLCPWRLVVAMAQATFSWPFGPIHLESACLRFRLTAKTAPAPLLLLFPANPLRWASPGGTGDIHQNATGDGSGWTLRVHIRLPYPLWPFGPSPPDRGSRPRTPFTRVTPLGGQYPSGAQNLSGFPRFPPVHWALGVQKLPLVRFSFRAWVSELMWLGGYRRRGGYQPPATPPAGPLGP